ncbi:MAG TPA: GNAT family N-acetyltransferase [Thermoanaerobaculia bacterium]
MPVDDRFHLRPYRDGDEAAILELFARSFPHAPRASEHFGWKYRASPYGSGRISLAFDRERLVGHYAGYPVPFRVDGRDVLAHQIGDTMTDPSVRHIGRGPSSILGRTALDFYSRFCDGAVAFNFGFNVANIQKFSLRFLRSHRVEPVCYRLLDLTVRPLKPMRRVEKALSGYQIEIVRHVDTEWDELFARVRRHYEFCVRRDAQWVRWRYLESPDQRYAVVAVRKWSRLVGWIVYTIRGDSLIWGDALFHPDLPDAPSVMLRHVVPPLHVNRVEGWFPARPRWFDAVLQELGFVMQPEPQDLSLMCVPFMMHDAVDRMRSSLYYTMGDGDLF